MDLAWDQFPDVDVDWPEFLSFDLCEISQPDDDSYNHDTLRATDNILHDTDTNGFSLNRGHENLLNTVYDQNPTFLFQISDQNPVTLHTTVVKHSPKPRYQSRRLLPATTSFDIVPESPEQLSTKFQKALVAVQGSNKRKAKQLDDHTSGFNSFRVHSSIVKENPREPKPKKQRLKRSLTRPCLLCKCLKLKCSLGRPCARCVERSMGQRDIGFTRCLRDHPSKFNLFVINSTDQNPLGNIEDCHDVGIVCFLASSMAYQCRSPQLFILTFSYLCYLKSTYSQSQRSSLLEKPGAASFWRDSQSELSLLAFQDLEKAFDSRGSSQHLANKNSRTLCIALSLYAWLGAASNVKKQDSTRSEKEETCKKYLSELIDLLIPRCIPGLSGIVVRNLLWTMCDLMIFPAIPQLNLNGETLHRMRSEVEVAASDYKRSLVKAMPLYSSELVNTSETREQFCRIYWPDWDRPPSKDARRQTQFLSLFTLPRLQYMIWTLGPRTPDLLNPFLDWSLLRMYPGLAKAKTITEWMEDAQKMLQPVSLS